MPKRTGIVVAAVVGAVLIVGGGAAVALTAGAQNEPVETSAASDPVADEVPEEAPGGTAEPVENGAEGLASKTNPGEVCDPHNLNDVICAAFYPDLVVVNMTMAPRAGEPLASMGESERIALAHEACAQLDSGATLESVAVVEEADAAESSNNFAVASAGALAFCNSHLDERLSWTLSAYQSMGEAAAKESFKDGSVIQPPA